MGAQALLAQASHLHPLRDTPVHQCFARTTSMAEIYNGLGDPRQGKKRGKELLSARDQIQDDIMNDACWCIYLYYGGCGCINPCEKGCCLAIGEVCCCAGTCKSATCCDVILVLLQQSNVVAHFSMAKFHQATHRVVAAVP